MPRVIYKTCKTCGETKSREKFYKHKTNLDKRQGSCKKCTIIKNKKYIKCAISPKKRTRKKHLDYVSNSFEYRKNIYLLITYGISYKQYIKMAVDQEYKCKICGIHQDNLTELLSVDHNHTTGKIRGLLCRNCNKGLGKFKDNKELIKNAISYLKTANVTT